ILGGETMVAHVASYRLLGTGSRPELDAPCRVHDEVDVADLESEAEHAYDPVGGTSATNLVIEKDGAADGGRSERTLERFRISLVPGGRFVARVDADGANELALFADGRALGSRALRNGGWQEVVWNVSSDARRGPSNVELRVVGGRITALHHWSLEACAER
ncbi:MAG TPA: hypothetical protein VMS65_14800, partial [Polyangiaceae bacterium]|nr:hypothetical protein [Polyangiaceae bacterium]